MNFLKTVIINTKNEMINIYKNLFLMAFIGFLMCPTVTFICNNLGIPANLSNWFSLLFAIGVDVFITLYFIHHPVEKLHQFLVTITEISLLFLLSATLSILIHSIVWRHPIWTINLC